MNGRADFQKRRYQLLSMNIDVSDSNGLEIGACDLPTVGAYGGKCAYADFRSAEDMVAMWNLSRDSVCHVDYVISREERIFNQIPDRFDYIVACHVLEHVPDVVSYINDIKGLLTTGPEKVIFLTLPDKRATLDRSRPSTTVELLLAYHYRKIEFPLFEHILEFHRHWVGYANGSGPLPLSEAYEYACRYVTNAEADVHCHVWEDQEFRNQCEELITAGFLPGLRLAHFEPLHEGTNEFAIVLKTT